MTGQVRLYYADLRNEKFETYLALVHSRFSTNTFPSWSRAQPMRMLCHNGEINTLKGNANWMRARESVIVSPKLGAERTQQMMPVIDKNQSDSGSYDNVLEFLYHGSERSLQECMLMMIQHTSSLYISPGRLRACDESARREVERALSVRAQSVCEAAGPCTGACLAPRLCAQRAPPRHPARTAAEQQRG